MSIFIRFANVRILEESETKVRPFQIVPSFQNVQLTVLKQKNTTIVDRNKLCRFACLDISYERAKDKIRFYVDVEPPGDKIIKLFFFVTDAAPTPVS